MQDDRQIGRDEMHDLAKRIKDCLEEAGIQGELHLGPDYAGVTAEAPHRDGTTVQIVAKIVAGEQGQGAGAYGVADDRFDPLVALSAPSLSVGPHGTAAASGPIGTAAEERR
jgi:hypothetical protein